MVEVRVEEYKGKFRFTIPRSELRKIQAKTDDYIKITLTKNNKICTYYGRIPEMPKCRTNLQTKKGVPKYYAKQINLKRKDFLDLKISKVKNVRSDNLIRDNYLDVLNVIPIKNDSNKTIMVEEFLKEKERWLKVWYCSGQGNKANEIELKRFVKIDKKLGEFFGLMQAESSKKGSKFTFTNNFLSEIELFIRTCEKFGISMYSWKFSLFYKASINQELTKKQIDLLKLTFKTKNKICLTPHKTLTNFCFCCYIEAYLLNYIMNNLLIKIRKSIYEIKSEELKEFGKGFITKCLLGDGTVIENEHSIDILLSEPDKIAQKDIIDILKLFDINSLPHGIKLDISTDFYSCIWFLENKVFFGHNRNWFKILKYINNNYYFNILYERLNNFNRGSIKDFSKLYNLNYSTTIKFLSDNKKRGYFNKIKKGVYEVSEKGRAFVKLIKENKLNYPLTTQSGTTLTTFLANPTS